MEHQIPGNPGKERERETVPQVERAMGRSKPALDRSQLTWGRTRLTAQGMGIALDNGIEVMHVSPTESGTDLIQNVRVAVLSPSFAGKVLNIQTKRRYQ